MGQDLGKNCSLKPFSDTKTECCLTFDIMEGISNVINPLTDWTCYCIWSQEDNHLLTISDNTNLWMEDVFNISQTVV